MSQTVQEIFQLFLHKSHEVATQEGLAKVLSFFDADRIYIGYYNDTDSSISFIHESTAEGVEHVTRLLNQEFNEKKQYEEKDYPFWIGNIKNGIDTIISDIDKLPMISETEIPLMKENNVQSSLTTSIHEKGKVCGFLGIEYVNRKHHWEVSEIETAHFFANIFSVVIENEYMQKEIEISSLEAFKNDTIFQIIFETLPVGIELYDEKGYLIKVNPYDQKLLGATMEDLLGVNLFENPNIQPGDLEKLKRGEPATFENDYCFDKVKEKNYFSSERSSHVMRLIGKCEPLKDQDGHIFGYLELVHHDTSYYKTKEELKSNLAKLNMAVEAQDAFFWEYNVKSNLAIVDLQSINANQKTEMQAFQEAYDTPLATHAQQIHPDDIERLKKKALQIRNGEIHSCKETYREYIGNDLRWISTCVQTFKYDEATSLPEIIVCLTTDITEQWERDLELIQGREFQKIRKAFVSNISHEIRTPLNAIVGLSKVITDCNTSKETEHLNAIIEQSNKELLYMIESILSFTELEAGTLASKKEEVDIKEICNSIAQSDLFRAHPNIDYIFDTDQPSLMAFTDKDYVKQSIYHLVDNANKFTKEGQIALLYFRNKKGDIQVEVSDTGAGLSQEESRKIFDHFYKNDPAKKGIGLGLSIVKRFIQELGGEVGVRSVKEKGSTFWFTLPGA